VGDPSWHTIAGECAHSDRLRDQKEKDFVADMVRWTVHGGEPTEKTSEVASIHLCPGARMTEKPQTFNGDLAHLPTALRPLTDEARWLVWSWEWRTTKTGNGKWTKPPRQARDPSRNARSNDPLTWSSYDQAVARVTAGDADGIGYALSGSPIGACDLDHCREADGTVARWAEDLCNEANGAYREITVSGSGLRIIGTANGGETHRKFTFDRKSGAGVELYRNTARYITVSGLEVSECAALPSLDGFIDTVMARHSGGPARAADGGLDFNAAERQKLFDYEDLIKNGAPEGQRSEAFQAVVWHLAGQGWSVEQITDELAKHPNGIGAKYADRLLTEVTRSYEKWKSHKRASVTGGEAPAGDWPQVFLTSGELPRVVDDAETALLGLGREIYQRGGQLVRPLLLPTIPPNDDCKFAPLTRPWLVEALTCAARFLKWDGRVKGYVAVDAPDDVAEALLSRGGNWKLPVLAGITKTPFLRRDGSLCERPGYDAASGLLFKPGNQTFPSIPEHPSKADAAEALALLDRLLDGFPFVSDAARAVALSAILTMLDRRSMTAAPLHAFTSPTAGTGKSLLVDIVATLATRRPMPVVGQGGHGNEEELEKRLSAALLAGDAAITIDNCEHALQSTFLCQALTQQSLNIRVLGFSKNIETPVNAAIYATGNNLTIVGDLTRRTLICGLDAHCERPELRTFDDNVLDTALEQRGPLVAAALTILRAWHIAGQRIDVAPFGSFESWSYRIREPLVWLECSDPCETVAKVREDDPRRSSLLTVITQWQTVLGTNSAHTIRQVVTAAINHADFHNALVAVAVARGSNNVVSNDRLGRWLKANEGKIVNGVSLIRGGMIDGYPLWRLQKWT
jgi:hypothetical protein